MIEITDETFNNLKWRLIDGRKLESKIAGLTIVGAEPTDYPLTDGITLYLKDKAGKLTALDIGADYITAKNDYNPFYMQIAKIPAPSA